MRTFSLMAVLAALFLHPCSASAQSSGQDPVHVAIDLTPELLERGVHGTVLLQADVNPEDRVAQLIVVESSGSGELDDFAISKLDNAPVSPNLLDEENRSLTLEVDLYAFDIGMDFARSYSCLQAVRDHDWYLAGNPDETIERGKYYHMFGGLAIVTEREEMAFAMRPDTREQAWLAALERCRTDGEFSFFAALIVAGNGGENP